MSENLHKRRSSMRTRGFGDIYKLINKLNALEKGKGLETVPNEATSERLSQTQKRKRLIYFLPEQSNRSPPFSGAGFQSANFGVGVNRTKGRLSINGAMFR